MAKQAARPALTVAKPLEEKTISSNRQARYEYEIMERFEAGEKLYDKRATLAERDARRDIEQRQRDH
ncbi:MAG: hypothetical protein LC793_04870 [Thermomicrobia bacterium]|nr:hypothetical protein [Thermomicrobia bacterium]